MAKKSHRVNVERERVDRMVFTATNELLDAASEISDRHQICLLCLLAYGIEMAEDHGVVHTAPD